VLFDDLPILLLELRQHGLLDKLGVKGNIFLGSFGCEPKALNVGLADCSEGLKGVEQRCLFFGAAIGDSANGGKLVDAARCLAYHII
jgi:hypothetical protein